MHFILRTCRRDGTRRDASLFVPHERAAAAELVRLWERSPELQFAVVLLERWTPSMGGSVTCRHVTIAGGYRCRDDEGVAR